MKAMKAKTLNPYRSDIFILYLFAFIAFIAFTKKKLIY
jgi:hypothetical protein